MLPGLSGPSCWRVLAVVREAQVGAGQADAAPAGFPNLQCFSLFSIIISRRKPPAAGAKGDGKLVNHRDALPLARDAALFT